MMMIVNSRFRASHSVYNTPAMRRRSARLTTAVVWRRVKQEAVAHILCSKPEFCYRCHINSDPSQMLPSGGGGRLRGSECGNRISDANLILNSVPRVYLLSFHRASAYWLNWYSNSVRLSVCSSVRCVPLFYKNGLACCHSFFATR